MAAPYGQQPFMQQQQPQQQPFMQQQQPFMQQQQQQPFMQQPQQMMQQPQQQPQYQQPMQQPQQQLQQQQVAPAAAPVIPSSPLFALLIPGRTLDTNFAVVDAKKMMIQVAQPTQITELTVCMLQPSIPADHGVAIYYALPPFADWQYLGSISLQYPTAAFRPVWRDKIPADTPTLGIGLAVETLQTISTLQPADAKEEERTLDSAKGIAKHLYEFMASYSQNTGQYKNLGDVLVIPTNCIDKWFEKFQHKHKLEPYFWMKKDIRATNMH